MLVFDASSIMWAWDNYPLPQFPGLWEWIDEQLSSGYICMPETAFEEVNDKMPDCSQWLIEKNLSTIDINNEITQEAMFVKQLIGIVNDNYHPKGVDEKDLFIISTAKVFQAELVSDEARQPNLPQARPKYKIPAVCSLPDVNVVCTSFVELI